MFSRYDYLPSQKRHYQQCTLGSDVPKRKRCVPTSHGKAGKNLTSIRLSKLTRNSEVGMTLCRTISRSARILSTSLQNPFCPDKQTFSPAASSDLYGSAYRRTNRASDISKSRTYSSAPFFPYYSPSRFDLAHFHQPRPNRGFHR